MKNSKNIISAILIGAMVPTIVLATAPKSTWTLDGNAIECKIENGKTWVCVPKDFQVGILENSANRKLKLSIENFKKANKIGNTYKQVCEIFGGKGNQQSKSLRTSSDDADDLFESFEWEDGNLRAYMQFHNGKITDTMFNDWHADYHQ